jgi:diguanylate cyclase (GGDEF)-like protein
MLTGVMNRNEMNNLVDRLSKGSEEGAVSIGVIFADLNGLKRVNDKGGHAAGDLLLKNAAMVLQNVFIGDEIYRAGGDEFMVLLSFTTEEEIKKKCRNVKALSKSYKDVSFALGYSYQNDSSGITDALRLADERMYEDKEKYYKEHPELKR